MGARWGAMGSNGERWGAMGSDGCGDRRRVRVRNRGGDVEGFSGDAVSIVFAHVSHALASEWVEIMCTVVTHGRRRVWGGLTGRPGVWGQRVGGWIHDSIHKLPCTPLLTGVEAEL